MERLPQCVITATTNEEQAMKQAIIIIFMLSLLLGCASIKPITLTEDQKYYLLIYQTKDFTGYLTLLYWLASGISIMAK